MAIASTSPAPTTTTPPVIGVPACYRTLETMPFHICGDKYLRAVSEGVGGLPFVIPALGHQLDPDQLLDRVDGLLFTGSPSNVEPWRYGGPTSEEGTRHDPERDATTLPLLERAIARGVPILAICRGLQELNVALGGTLFQKVGEIPGRMNHAGDSSRPIIEQYGLAHEITIEADGYLAELLGVDTLTVNSLHNQGIDRLADGLAVEAAAPDGQIEAVSWRTGPGFALAVQWHPEWDLHKTPGSQAIFSAFRGAVDAFRRGECLIARPGMPGLTDRIDAARAGE